MIKVYYYVGFTENLNKDLKRNLKNKVDSFNYELDYLKLIERVRLEQPDVLVLDYSEYSVSYKLMNIFSDSGKYYVPIVIVAGNINPETNLNGPSNYIYLKYNEIPVSLDIIKATLQKARYNTLNYKRLEINNLDLIDDTLMALGFNMSTKGTTFLKICLSQILLNNCEPSFFSSDLFDKISEKHNITTACISRCITVALEYAWKHCKDRNKRLPSGISFSDFNKCPSAKEFIYYAANKLYNYKQKLHFGLIDENQK